MAPDTTRAGQTQPVTNTPVRHIRIEDKLWNDARDTARDQGETVPHVLRLALIAYKTDPAATVAALVNIRGNAR